MVIEYIGTAVVNNVRVIYKRVTYKDGKKTLRAYNNQDRIICATSPKTGKPDLVTLHKLLKGII